MTLIEKRRSDDTAVRRPAGAAGAGAGSRTTWIVVAVVDLHRCVNLPQQVPQGGELP